MHSYTTLGIGRPVVSQVLNMPYLQHTLMLGWGPEARDLGYVGWKILIAFGRTGA